MEINNKLWKELTKYYTKGELSVEKTVELVGCSKAKAEKLIWAITHAFIPAYLGIGKFSKIEMNKVIAFIKNQKRSILEISNKFKLSSDEVIELMKYLGSLKYNISHIDNSYIADNAFPKGSYTMPKKDNILRFGLVSDQHMGSHWFRQDVLDEAYDFFEKEGIELVFNAGNWIEGEAKFNRQDVSVHGLTPQINFCAMNYPYRKNIKTKFISADDHEGWYSQASLINIGDYLQQTRESLQMFDMEHLGYVEADIKLTSNPDWEHESWMRLMHPGGGTAYAVSYTSQKIVESFQGGEKPNILALGHFHKFDYMCPRNVHAIQIPCMEDQSIFGRKKRIEFVLGFVMVEAYFYDSGVLKAVKVHFEQRFNKGFYTGKDKWQRYK